MTTTTSQIVRHAESYRVDPDLLPMEVDLAHGLIETAEVITALVRGDRAGDTLARAAELGVWLATAGGRMRAVQLAAADYLDEIGAVPFDDEDDELGDFDDEDE